MIWYNASTMPQPIPIDISNIPELARIAEEVEATKTPRELKRENKTVAVIVAAKKVASLPFLEVIKAFSFVLNGLVIRWVFVCFFQKTPFLGLTPHVPTH